MPYYSSNEGSIAFDDVASTIYLSLFRGFDRVVFNFPDRGVGNKGMLAVKANQDMIAGFLKGVKGLLAKHGEVHVAVSAAQQVAWNVVGIAARGGLKYRAQLNFKPEVGRCRLTLC